MGALFNLTGTPILVMSIVVAVVCVGLILVVAYVRVPRTVKTKLLRMIPITFLVLFAQFAAVMAVFLSVNDHFGLYTSWDDLNGEFVGVGNPGKQIAANGTTQLPHGDGRLDDEILMKYQDKIITVLFWLPPGYDDPANKDKKYPVVMLMPGQPGSGNTVYHDFDFANTALAEMRAGKIPPFIAVLPSLMIAPPRDTECTDVPKGGPQAESWVSDTIPAYTQSHYRTQPMGKDWSLMGWSTGGFCAAKLMMRHPTLFSSATSFGGYFSPLSDGTTGDLFGGSAILKNQNSPLWLYSHGGLHGTRLLVIAGQQDKQASQAANAMVAETADDPNVSLVTFAEGGHNFKNYASYLGQALEWASQSWTP